MQRTYKGLENCTPGHPAKVPQRRGCVYINTQHPMPGAPGESPGNDLQRAERSHGGSKESEQPEMPSCKGGQRWTKKWGQKLGGLSLEQVEAAEHCPTYGHALYVFSFSSSFFISVFPCLFILRFHCLTLSSLGLAL